MVAEITIRKAFEKWESELVTPAGTSPSKDIDKVRLWREIFIETSEEQFREAAILVIRKLRFFPKPAEVLDLISGSFDDICELAWQGVRGAIQRLGTQASWFASDLAGDTAALHAVEALGLETLGEMDDDNRAIVRKQFERAYHLAVERRLGIGRIAGAFERQNRCAGMPMTNPALFGRSVVDTCPELQSLISTPVLTPGDDAREIEINIDLVKRV